LLSEFIPVNQIIPTEGVWEYLIVLVKEPKVKSTYEILNKGYGGEEFKIGGWREKSLSYKTFEIDTTAFEVEIPEPLLEVAQK
jgi:sulfite reductase (ferredoxin)